jgi:hypothetical protein
MTQDICRIILPVILLVTSCTKKFDEINKPKAVLPESGINSATVGQAFAYAQYWGIGARYIQVEENLHGQIFAQYYTTNVGNFSTETYAANGSWVNLFWNDFYAAAALMQLTAERITAEEKLDLANAMTKVWRVVMYHRMTDYFGPIIYSQYGNGERVVEFDAQRDIYLDFFKTLDEAVAVLKANTGKTAFGTVDQVYRGDANKWLKFANSLRLRLAMRIVYAEPALAKAEAEKAVADGVMTSNADFAGVASTLNNPNIYSRITYLSNDYRASSSMISTMTGYNDPRLPVYFTPAATGGGFKGLRNGLTAAQRGIAVAPLTSFVGPQWISNPPRAGTLNPTRIMCAAELAFLRAEGALRGWNMGGTAKDFYNTGISLSLTENVSGIAPGVISAYQNSTALPVALTDTWNSPAMTNIPVLYDEAGSFERRLEQIITQKWLAVYPDGYEAWAERRRTGYPRGYALITSDEPMLSKTELARRLIFAPAETTTNPDGYATALSRLGGADNMKTRVWWDKKPLSDYPVPSN